jgi:hypothetical protein
MASSIDEIGLRTPITVKPLPKQDHADAGVGANSYLLLTGAHRLAAARSLGWLEIKAFVAGEDVSDLAAELWEIDENICRASLTPAEEAAAMARRKELYLRAHPETAHGATGKGRSKAQSRKDCDSEQVADRFTADTAKKTGKAERSVQLSTKRGEGIGIENARKLARTSLDKGVELDALAKLSPDDRGELIERAAAGEKVTARRPKSPERRDGCCRTCGAPKNWRQQVGQRDAEPAIEHAA